MICLKSGSSVRFGLLCLERRQELLPSFRQDRDGAIFLCVRVELLGAKVALNRGHNRVRLFHGCLRRTSVLTIAGLLLNALFEIVPHSPKKPTGTKNAHRRCGGCSIDLTEAPVLSTLRGTAAASPREQQWGAPRLCPPQTLPARNSVHRYSYCRLS